MSAGQNTRFRVRRPKNKTIRARRPKEELRKAPLDKTKLIPINKQVNGKHGPYMQIKWCGTGEAITTLKNHVEEKYSVNPKEVEYQIKTGKHKGKKIDLNEVINQQRKFNAKFEKKDAMALQDYLDEYFEVVKKPEAKKKNENNNKKKLPRIDNIDDSRYDHDEAQQQINRKKYLKDTKILEKKIQAGDMTVEKTQDLIEKLGQDLSGKYNIETPVIKSINTGIMEQTLMHLIARHSEDMEEKGQDLIPILKDPDEIYQQENEFKGRKSYIFTKKDSDLIVIVEGYEGQGYTGHLNTSFIPTRGMDYVLDKTKTRRPVWTKGQEPLWEE